MELEPWIETYSGIKFEFLNPKPHMITITDIAHSLSRQCRFSGHTSEFYSVAEHCVNVAIELAKYGPEVQMQGLLHDASEAYLLDVPSPVKQYLTNYKEMEETIQKAIFKTYGITYPYAQVVKDADAVLLKKEAQKLLPSQGNSWVHLYPTPWESDIRIECLKSDHAYGAYIAWFNFLMGDEHATRSQEAV